MLIRLLIAKLLRTPATIMVVPATSCVPPVASDHRSSAEVAAKVVYLPLSYASQEDSGDFSDGVPFLFRYR